MEITPMFIVACLNFALLIIVGCFNWFSHNKLVGNDLFHINEDVKMILATQQTMSKTVTDVQIDLAYVKGKCDQNTYKRTFKKSKKFR